MKKLDQSAEWLCVRCEVQGQSHVHSHTPCQDKTFSCTYNGVTAVALADGAGSCTLSHYGADAAAKAVCKVFCEQFDGIFFSENPTAAKKKLVSYLQKVMVYTAEQYDCELKELSSTLLAVAVKDSRILALHIGDGVIGFLNKDGAFLLSEPQNTEFANQTFFVTSGRAEELARLFRGVPPDLDGFVLMSDGSAASLYSSANHRLASVLSAMGERLALTGENYYQARLQENMQEEIARKTRDDCSLVLLAKKCSYYDLSEEDKYSFFDLAESEKAKRDAMEALLSGSEAVVSEEELEQLTDGAKDAAAALLELEYLKKREDGVYERAFCLH